MAAEPEPIYLEDRTAGAYLTQARNALLDCGRARKLYGSFRLGEDTDESTRIKMHLRAQDRQLDAARTSILFSALAAEAYINGWLGLRLESGDYDAVERLPTVDKFVIGPELALGMRLFKRGAEPAQSISQLFRLRHDLVHPKSRRVKVDRGSLIDERFARFNSESAASFVLAVTQAAKVLADHAKPAREPDAIVRGILSKPAKLLDFGRSLKEGVPPPPKAARIQEYARTVDPFSVPSTVPHDAREFLKVLSNIPGTATGPMMPGQP